MSDSASDNLDSFARNVRVGTVTGQDFIDYFNACDCKPSSAFEMGPSPSYNWILLVKPMSAGLKDAFGLTRELVVHFSQHREFQARALALRQKLEQRLPPGRIEESVDIVVCDDPHTREILAAMPQNNRVLVHLSSEDVSKEMREGRPSVAFRHRLQEKLYASDFFNRAGPVEGQDFIGRSLFLQKLTRTLSAGSHVGMYGLRKVGKTSIIRELISRSHTIAPDITWVYLDLLGILDVNRTQSHLLYRIAEDLRIGLGPSALKSMGCDMLTQEHRYDTLCESEADLKAFCRSFDEDFRRLLRHMRDQGRRVVLVLDEIEQLFPIPGQRDGFEKYDEFLRYVRGLSQNIGTLTLFVVGVNPQVSEAQFLGNRQNPMFSFFTVEYVPAMSADDVRDLLRSLGRPSGVTFENEAVLRLYELVGGHPYLLRRYCSLLIRDSRRPITLTADEVSLKRADFVRAESSVLSEMVSVVKEYYREEFAALHRVAVEGSVPEGSINNQILAHLEGCQLVAVRDGQVAIGTAIMGDWLANLSRTAAASVGVEQLDGEISIADRTSNDQVAAKECIETTERTLRRVIRAKLNERWGGRADKRIHDAIGTEAVAKAEASMTSSLQKWYPDVDSYTKEFLDYVYIGDLRNIICGREWDVFRVMFGDKQEVQRNLGIIAAARNEFQHYRDLPPDEVLRVILAAKDVLKRLKPPSNT
jgi:Cdc6-like AAA superfamily ATPase